ncbi:MAG: UDP-N-acetylmuramate dehydrogenase, partial [Planctomycetota bacterium]
MNLLAGILENKSLAPHNWYRVGGTARYYAKPISVDELKDLTDWAHQEQLPVFLLGRGANVLFADAGFDGLVIHTKSLVKKPYVLESGLIEVEVGQDLEKLIGWSNRHGYQGLEGFVGIPSTMGGAVWGNAGAADGGIGKLVSEVQLIEPGGALEWIDGRDLAWDYRYSGIQDRVIARVRLELTPGFDAENLQKRSDDLLQKKKDTQPFENKTCGCVFRNPDGMSAGQLIEDCQLKGRTSGGAMISNKHANFIENVTGKASSHDIEVLIELIQETVREKYGVSLKNEVVMPGS